MSLHKLFSPIKIKAMELKNRIVMAPMGNGQANEDGSVSQRLIDYYEARARGGAGLIMLGSTSVDSVTPHKGLPHIWDDKFIPGLRNLTDAVHSHGAKIFPQLCHPGGMGSFDEERSPESFSLQEINRIIEQFGEAAVRAKQAGFDGVEVHAAHGWMVLGSFTSLLHNRRIDNYGGSLENCTELLRKVIQYIRELAGKEFPVDIRISADELIPGGRTLRETQYIVPLLVEAGVDALNVSGGLHGGGVIMEGLGPMISFARAVKDVVNVPVMVVNNIRDPRFAEDILERNEADLIVMGRALLADPELPVKAAEGRFDDIAPCVGCGACRSRPGVPVCLVNPLLNNEKEMIPAFAARQKEVLVVGGGPAGLMAAGTAALRGHKVTLYEKENQLGGQFRLASMAPAMQKNIQVIKYLYHRALKAGVNIQVNIEMTPDKIEQIKPNAVVIATGAIPFIPDIPGIENIKIVTAHEVLAGKTKIRPGKAVIIGGGSTGCEVADMIAEPGNTADTCLSVTVIEMQPDVAPDMGMTDNRAMLMQRMQSKGVQILTSTILIEFVERGIRIVRNGREEIIQGVDSIILAMGVKSVDRLSSGITGKVAEVYVIGDARDPGRAVEAIAAGDEAGRQI